jgi:hypothetical protein
MYITDSTVEPTDDGDASVSSLTYTVVPNSPASVPASAQDLHSQDGPSTSTAAAYVTGRGVREDEEQFYAKNDGVAALVGPVAAPVDEEPQVCCILRLNPDLLFIH